MVQAFGVPGVGSGTGRGSGTGGSAGVLETQLARYEIQLTDWCSCPSGKTPDGKAKIQQIQDKAAAVKAQPARIAIAQERHQNATASIGRSNADPGSRVSFMGNRSVAAGVSTIGSCLDAFS